MPSSRSSWLTSTHQKAVGAKQPFRSIDLKALATTVIGDVVSAPFNLSRVAEPNRLIARVKIRGTWVIRIVPPIHPEPVAIRQTKQGDSLGQTSHAERAWSDLVDRLATEHRYHYTIRPSDVDERVLFASQ